MRRRRRRRRTIPSPERLTDMSDLDEQKPSRRLWIFAGVWRAGASRRRRGAGDRASADRRGRRRARRHRDRDRARTGFGPSRSDRPAAGTGHRRVDGVAAARRAEGRGQGNRPAAGQADRRPKKPDRVVTPNESKKPKEDDPKIAAVQTAASTESVAPEATATPSSEAIPEGPRSIAPAIGTGETARRVRATWQKELVAHLDKHKRYPSERSAKGRRDLGPLHARPAGPRAFDQRSKRAPAMRRSTRRRSRWCGAPIRCRAPPPLVADEGLSFTLPVIFRVKGEELTLVMRGLRDSHRTWAASSVFPPSARQKMPAIARRHLR